MSALDSFRTVRWFRTLNLLVQALLFLTLFGGLNYIALNHDWGRIDLTRHHRYSLSPETLAYLANLDQPVRVIVTMSEDSEHPEVAAALPDVRGLLREYVYATAGNHDDKTGHDGRVTVDYLDVDRQPREAARLGIEQRDTVVFLCGNKSRVLAPGELYHVVNGAAKDFIGEQAFTSAILDVSNPERKKIYFLVGDGEARIEDTDPARGLSVLADALRLRNFSVESFSLNTARSRVPDDAALVIAVGPQKVSAYAQEQLRQYLGPRAGHLLLLLAPGAVRNVPLGLTDLLLDWGVLADDDVVYDTHNRTEQGDLLIDTLGVHPITQSLLDMRIPLLVSRARSLHPIATRGLIVNTLAITSPTAWGEVNFKDPPRYDESDIKGLPQMEPKNALALIIASTHEPPRDQLPYTVPSGRLVVFGSTDPATNNGFPVAGNQNLLLNAVNWAIGREQLNVPARPVERFKLSLSEDELMRLRYSLLFGVPGAAALLGLIVYWTRRS
ncbi:MAG TPA: GldG family protein [Opitutaceae bacterium]|nr:GldG family protein [Opitutaceae bacterium]